MNLYLLSPSIGHPCINNCFAEFISSKIKFYYALGAIKNVGFEAINQIVQERKKNGKFQSISNFIERTNPKNINKLQLEGLVKAGAFDELESNRKSLYDSIPNLIITPHVSSDDNGNYVKLTLNIFIKNLKLFIENKELSNQVDKKLGY